MTTNLNPPPIFTHLLNPQLPPHIVQSADLQHLTCRNCSTTCNLSYEPNYHKFIYEHTHLPQYPEKAPPKPWPTGETIMRSIQVAQVFSTWPELQAKYSELQVLSSANGYYIGTLFTNEDGYLEPGSRDSDYYSTKERANYALTYLNNLYGLLRHEMSAEEIVDKWAKHMYTMGYDPRRVGYRFRP